MNKGDKFKKWELALLFAVCVTLLTGLWAGREQTELSEKLVRLHVVAVSDSDEEQALKLRVRDGVLEYLGPLLENAEDAESAAAVIAENLSGVQSAAEALAEGRTVSVSLTRESFPTRDYEGFSLPAGEYGALRVVLGEGKGQNWWCVVFPPLCLGAATEGENAPASLTESDMALITEDGAGYRIKFRVIELWGQLRALLS